MIRARIAGLAWSVLTVALVTGACESAPAEEPRAELICRDLASDPADHHRVSDTPIIHGFIVSGGGKLGFRPCNSNDRYFIQAPIAVWDTLEGGSRSDVSGDPRYVRFHGVELECTTDIPEPYVGGIRIEELLSTDSPPPANCE